MSSALVPIGTNAYALHRYRRRAGRPEVSSLDADAVPWYARAAGRVFGRRESSARRIIESTPAGAVVQLAGRPLKVSEHRAEYRGTILGESYLGGLTMFAVRWTRRDGTTAEWHYASRDQSRSNRGATAPRLAERRARRAGRIMTPTVQRFIVKRPEVTFVESPEAIAYRAGSGSRPMPKCFVKESIRFVKVGECADSRRAELMAQRYAGAKIVKVVTR